MGNFLKDLAESQVAVDAVLDYLIDRGFVAHELEGKREQKRGDIRYYPEGDMDKPMDLEIKYDKMSKRTGNMCFEVANNKGMTGICKTKADRIVYVCPSTDKFEVYLFDPTTLKEFLFNPASDVKFANGGDKKRFMLALVKKTTIISEGVWCQRWEIPNA